MLRNIRYAVRVLARTPAFTVTIVATLAIVIGANATVFSLIDAVLLKPLPFPDADRLVLLSESREGTPISNTAPVRIEEWNAANPNVMVNTAFAARYFGASPVGRNLGRIDDDLTYRITGVVGDAREFALDRAPVPTVYACLLAYANPALAFLVRTRGDPAAMTESVRTKIKELEPLRAVCDVAPLAERIGNEYSQDRLRMTALSLFSLVALSLACLGVYGTLSYVVSLRRREVGLRVALGAQRGNIVAQFLTKALRVVAIACLVGLVLSFAFSRVLSGMLFGVSPFDAATLVGVVALVTSVAVVAALVPAVRAARVDPMTVLREE